MATILQSLKSLSGYPIPLDAVREITDGVGLYADSETTLEVRDSNEFKRAQARVYSFLSEAPNVSQGGISYSFSAYEKQMFKKKAENILAEIGDEDGAGVAFGYQGEHL